MLIDFPHDPAGVSECNDAGWDVFGHDASGSDDGIIADRNARKDDGPSPDPDIVPDMDVFVELIVLHPQFGEDGMGCGGQGDVGSDHDMVADIDIPVIDRGQVEIRVEIVADEKVPSPEVRVKRSLDVAILATFPEHFAQEFSSFLQLAGKGVVIFEHQIPGLCLLFGDGRIATIIDLAFQHSFFVIHNALIVLVLNIFCSLFRFCWHFFQLRGEPTY